MNERTEVVECCHVCEQPKSRTNAPGEETERGWPVCINPDCVAFGESSASACYRSHRVVDDGGHTRGEDK